MTRLIVRNLPDKITKEKLHELFSEKGTVTDIQLKFTKSGKFRKFAFVGYQKQEHADAAINTLNKSFINTSRIEIEQCKGLADPEKPRAWSKHAPDSSAYQKRKPVEVEGISEDVKRHKKDDRKKIKDPKLEKLLSEYKDDATFKEFVEAQMPDDKTLLEVIEPEPVDEKPPENEPKLADRSISDLEYLKLKTGQEQLSIGKVAEEKVEDGKEKKKKKEPKNIKLYTVKIKGLPVKFKKSEIRAFLEVKPFTIRRACGSRDLIFAGFTTESGMKKALLKNRSFFWGRRIHVREVKDDKKENECTANEKWQQQEARLKNEETIAESGRIFIRNLPYVIAEDDVRELFERYGPLAEIVLPIDSFTRKPKGFGIVTFVLPEHAAKAFTDLDGTIFQGRMLHLLPGMENKKEECEEEGTGTNYKLNKLRKEKKSAGDSKNWNTFFVNENSLAAAMADTYNTTKENVLEDKNAAVRLALGETQIINKMKEFLEENGVCLDSLNNISKCQRSRTVMLVKNLPFGTTAEEMKRKFSEFGELARVVLPPNGVTAIVEFIEPSEARKAFRRVAYSKFRNVPMYLEWAPEKIFKEGAPPPPKEESAGTQGESREVERVERIQPESEFPFGADYVPLESSSVEGATLYVKNLNFTTEEDSVRQHFSKCGRVMSVTIAQKKDSKHPGKKLSLGYGFVQFSSKEEADEALKTLQFSKLDDHTLELKRSNRATKTDSSNVNHHLRASEIAKPSTKILVKNVPFQATEKEVCDIFKVFGEVKVVRLPKKMVGTGSHRGFGFVEYHTVHDAKRAFNALCQSTHLYGRRLVLEWASQDDEDVDVMRMKTAERFQTGKKQKKAVSMEDEAAAAAAADDSD